MENIMTLDREEMFDYLDVLRETGVTNMLGAAPYLQNAFGIEKSEAKVVLLEWMKNYAQRPI
jgi:hypothetical protein